MRRPLPSCLSACADLSFLLPLSLPWVSSSWRGWCSLCVFHSSRSSRRILSRCADPCAPHPPSSAGPSLPGHSEGLDRYLGHPLLPLLHLHAPRDRAVSELHPHPEGCGRVWTDHGLVSLSSSAFCKGSRTDSHLHSTASPCTWASLASTPRTHPVSSFTSPSLHHALRSHNAFFFSLSQTSRFPSETSLSDVARSRRLEGLEGLSPSPSPPPPPRFIACVPLSSCSSRRPVSRTLSLSCLFSPALGLLACSRSFGSGRRGNFSQQTPTAVCSARTSFDPLTPRPRVDPPR